MNSIIWSSELSLDQIVVVVLFGHPSHHESSSPSSPWFKATAWDATPASGEVTSRRVPIGLVTLRKNVKPEKITTCFFVENPRGGLIMLDNCRAHASWSQDMYTYIHIHIIFQLQILEMFSCLFGCLRYFDSTHQQRSFFFIKKNRRQEGGPTTLRIDRCIPSLGCLTGRTW